MCEKQKRNFCDFSSLIYKNTFIHRDTLIYRDTFIHRDTLSYRDTFIHRDTLIYRDTFIHRDTLIQRHAHRGLSVTAHSLLGYGCFFCTTCEACLFPLVGGEDNGTGDPVVFKSAKSE